MNRLLSTNWLLATVDGKNVGLVPVNYIKRPEVNQMSTHPAPAMSENVSTNNDFLSNQNPIGEFITQPQQADLVMEPAILKDDNNQSQNLGEVIKKENEIISS